MPSGKVHDWVTIGTALGAIPLTGMYLPPETRPLAWLAIASYTFSGVWLSSDLDVDSSAYRRWGPLRVLWYPYQKLVPHRSWVSHGLGIGPILRVAYLIAVLLLLIFGLNWVLARIGLALQVDAHSWLLHATDWIFTYQREAWALVIGLVAGGAAHSLLDFAHTRLKRWF
ncbi:MAG: metal-binding protein [Fimbriimonadales bacterium]|nr:metal-binding protein [Fimbriimonadales bacterium]